MYVKVILAIIIFSAITTGIGLVVNKYNSMSNLIIKQERDIEILKNMKIVLEADVKIEKDNVSILSELLEKANQEVKILEVKYDSAIKKFNDFKRKSNEEKYRNKETIDLLNSKIWESSKCETGLEINAAISKLNFKDL